MFCSVCIEFDPTLAILFPDKEHVSAVEPEKVAVVIQTMMAYTFVGIGMTNHKDISYPGARTERTLSLGWLDTLTPSPQCLSIRFSRHGIDIS